MIPEEKKNGPFEMSSLNDLRERVERVTPRIKAFHSTLEAYSSAEEGLGYELLCVAWPALLAIAAHQNDRRWKLLDDAYIVAEEQPCLEVRGEEGERMMLRGETQIAARLDQRHVSETAMAIQRSIAQWERETEGDTYLDRLKAETAELLELRRALRVLVEKSASSQEKAVRQ